MKQHKPPAKARSKTPAGASSGGRGRTFAAKPAFKASPKPVSDSRSSWSPMDSEPDAEMLQAGRDNERWLEQREAEHRRATQKPAGRPDRSSERSSERPAERKSERPAGKPSRAPDRTADRTPERASGHAQERGPARKEFSREYMSDRRDGPPSRSAERQQERQPKQRNSEQRAQRQEQRKETHKDTRRPEATVRRASTDDQPRLTGGEIIYGRHAVAAALQNPARTLLQIWLSDAALAETLPIPRDLKPQIADRRTLDRMVGDRLRSDGESAVHQGIVLVAEPLADVHLRDLLSDEKSGPLVILDQVTDPHNLGAILRSAAVFGAAALITTERHAPAASGVMSKAASGAIEAVPIIRVVNLARALREIGDAGYWRLGLAEGGTQTIGEAAAGRDKVALVLGAEGDGMRRLTRENCDALVSLTAAAPADSFTTLNVSNAAAVALFAISQSA